MEFTLDTVIKINDAARNFFALTREIFKIIDSHLDDDVICRINNMMSLQRKQITGNVEYFNQCLEKDGLSEKDFKDGVPNHDMQMHWLNIHANAIDMEAKMFEPIIRLVITRLREINSSDAVNKMIKYHEQIANYAEMLSDVCVLITGEDPRKKVNRGREAE